METVELIPIGTKVNIIQAKLEAFVTGISVRQNGMSSYEMSYFQNGQHTNCWLHRFEFDIIEPTSKKPGFVNYDINQKQLI